MSSPVAVCKSCVSLRPAPSSTPCVNTPWPLDCPYAPSGANVTALAPGSSRQFEGTLTRNRPPSVYVVNCEDGGATRPVGVGCLCPPGCPPRPAFLVACSVVGAGDSCFKCART